MAYPTAERRRGRRLRRLYKGNMFNVVEETSKMAVESDDIRRLGIVTDDGGSGNFETFVLQIWMPELPQNDIFSLTTKGYLPTVMDGAGLLWG